MCNLMTASYSYLKGATDIAVQDLPIEERGEWNKKEDLNNIKTDTFFNNAFASVGFLNVFNLSMGKETPICYA